MATITTKNLYDIRDLEPGKYDLTISFTSSSSGVNQSLTDLIVTAKGTGFSVHSKSYTDQTIDKLFDDLSKLSPGQDIVEFAISGPKSAASSGSTSSGGAQAQTSTSSDGSGTMIAVVAVALVALVALSRKK